MIDALESLSFRTMFDGAANAMLFTDDSGHVVLVNPAAQQLFGYSADEISLCPITTQQQLYVLITFNVANRHLDAEEALRAGEERLRLAKQATDLAIFMLNQVK